jgi:hypothetical protein
MTAVPTKTATSAYVTGVVSALQSVDDSIEATPFVERAVYPPINILARETWWRENEY